MYQIVYEQHTVYEFAAEELAKYYAKITGQILLRHKTLQQQGTPIVLGSPAFIKEVLGVAVPTEKLRYDGYWILSDDQKIAVSGLEKRSVLYGVYRLLEDVGCKWMFPGPEGEILPKTKTLQFKQGEIIDNPDFEVRASTDDTKMDEIPDSYIIETLEKFDWAGKNRLNTYFQGCNMFNGDMYLRPMIMRELNKRGFRLEVGGHSTWIYVRRELFGEKPELFREVDGVRRADGNFCSSNSEAVQMVVDGVGNLLKQVPAIECFHLWFEDTFGGSWCTCEKCKDLTPAQQMMNVIKAVALAYPQLHVDFILYHDSGDVSSITQQLPENISAYYAPRERCYAHRLSDPDCARNVVYHDQVRHAREVFASIYPFEYWTDMILFNKMGINLQRTMHEDLFDYKDLGVNAITLLMFNRYSWFAYKLSMATFARHTWSMDCDYMAVRKELCDIYYKDQSAAMMTYYDLQEQFTDLMLQFCGYDDVHDIRNIIPLNPEFGEKHLQDLVKAESILKEMEAVLNEAINATDDVAVCYLLHSELQSVYVTQKTASITHRLMRARQDKAFNGMSDEAFDKVMDDLIADHEVLAEYGYSLPTALVGINGKTTFEDHLCGDLNTFYRTLKSQGVAKDFKTF
ncbi:MAG: DUF4838 domain-containing protein [Clostridia bacterium]|nr:DUF4838 domain-containing protein [Clostridia bacterium]